MFAPHHKLENLLLIVDDNRISMLDYCENILDHSPLAEKFRAFGWTAVETDGHNIKELYDSLTKLKATRRGVPKALIARTVKGRGVRELESDRLCHIRTLSPERVLELAGSGA
jgi:transketolase